MEAGGRPINFQDLPNEAAYEVLKHLPVGELFVASSVDRRMNALAIDLLKREYGGLKELRLNGANITNSEARLLTFLPELEHISFKGCVDITDRALLNLNSHRHLQSLDLSATEITDLGLATVSGLKGLTDLSLASCPNITDQGILSLTTLTNLTSLDIRFCPQISHDALQALKTVLPGLQILESG